MKYWTVLGAITSVGTCDGQTGMHGQADPARCAVTKRVLAGGGVSLLDQGAATGAS